ncbi:MAG: hypothetical protein AAGA69_11915, partial [Pseudomonadota bacterium]
MVCPIDAAELHVHELLLSDAAAVQAVCGEISEHGIRVRGDTHAAHAGLVIPRDEGKICQDVAEVA